MSAALDECRQPIPVAVAEKVLGRGGVAAATGVSRRTIMAGPAKPGAT